MGDKNLTNSFENEIFNTTSELSQDYAELALDSLTSESLLSEIPIVKSLVSFYKITSSIVDRHNVKKILVFLEEFHSKNIDENKLKEFKGKFKENPKHRNQVLETILLLNEKFIDTEKSKILANLFSAHVEDNLTWEEFIKMSFILTNLNPAGYKFLEKYVDKESSIRTKLHESIEGEALLMACGIGTMFDLQFKPTRTAIKLYEYGLKPLKK
ncbi:hypothetical protein L3X37_14955 [Sabulilitoribacter arenilitoris]|uniref:Uncharacterized protein n=1 Tax=Wocania arenilitoris TaxID=2044858 RepID=A0AAE3ESS5_9FLAO|nr:hypothetical protein [Wocania arenilitoris]MCF7569644.1 hypothetical protein [Wocania arenilitoris]